MVVLSHMPQITNTDFGSSLYTLIKDLNLGYLGVDLFFVLSGFLITRILLRDKKAGTYSFKLFYIKRALRIFPIYFLTILVCGIVFSWKGMGYLSIYTANYYFSFNPAPHPLEHTWSLSVEEHYYLIWPLIVFFFSRKIIKKYLWPFLLLILSLSLLLAYNTFGDTIFSRLIYMGTEFRILTLCTGSFLAFYEARLMALNKVKLTRWLLLCCIVSFTLIVMMMQKLFEAYVPISILGLLLFAMYSTFLFMTVLVQEKRNNVIDTLFGNTYIGYVGKLSYGLYLYHFPIFYAFGITDKLDGEFIPFSEFAPPMLFTIVVTVISYIAIEKPLMNYKTALVLKFNKNLKKQPS